MPLQASFCDPFKPDVIHLGEIDKEKVISQFEQIPWLDLIKEVYTRAEEPYYSPSFSIDKTENGHGVEVTIVTESDWYIFYKRPKMVRKFFGLYTKMQNDYLTDILDQDMAMVKRCLQAMIDSDYDFLEHTVKR